MTRLIRPENSIEVKETLINFILDETGSMAECLKATIGGFNEYIQTLKTEATDEAPIRLSLTKFNSSKQDGAEIVYTNKDVRQVPELTAQSFVPNAMTPLYDAIGRTVKFVEEELASKKKRKQPKIVCVILTDGQENDSHHYTKEDITELIKKKEKEDWNFVFLGANQNAWEVGISMGIPKGNISGYTVTPQGYREAFRGLAVDTISYHALQAPMSKSFVSHNYEVNDKEGEDSNWPKAVHDFKSTDRMVKAHLKKLKKKDV
jgi:hypothetical protein